MFNFLRNERDLAAFSCHYHRLVNNGRYQNLDIVYENSSTVLKADPRWDPSEGTEVTLTCDTQKLKLRDWAVDPVEWSVVFADSRDETVLTPTNAAALPIGNSNGIAQFLILSELVLYFPIVMTYDRCEIEV